MEKICLGQQLPQAEGNFVGGRRHLPKRGIGCTRTLKSFESPSTRKRVLLAENELCRGEQISVTSGSPERFLPA